MSKLFDYRNEPNQVNLLEVQDIVDNTTTIATDKPLSANMGKVLKDELDQLDDDKADKDFAQDTNNYVVGDSVITYITADKKINFKNTFVNVPKINPTKETEFNIAGGQNVDIVGIQTDTIEINIDDEIQAREDADTVLQTNIDTEKTARETDYENLYDKIEDEIENRTVADIAEQTSRIAEDNILQAEIDSLTGNVNSQITNIDTAITTEATARENADATLQTNITTVATNLSTETANRITKDGETLQSAKDYANELALAVHNWLQSVETLAELYNITPPFPVTKNYLCKVINDPDKTNNATYQWIAGTTEWTLFSRDEDFIDEIELEAAIAEHDTGEIQHENIIGLRTDLTTTDKTTIVNAINEVNTKASSLTDDKADKDFASTTSNYVIGDIVSSYVDYKTLNVVKTAVSVDKTGQTKEYTLDLTLGNNLKFNPKSTTNIELSINDEIQARENGDDDTLTSAKLYSDDNLATAKNYTDGEIANAERSKQIWLPAVQTLEELEAITPQHSDTVNYLCRVMNDVIKENNGVWQWVAGATAWTYFSDNLDFVDDEELEEALATKLDKNITDGDYVYTHNGTNQGHKAYTLAPTASTIAERTNTGTLRGTTATDENDLVNFSQFNTALDNKLDKTANAISATKLQTARTINGVNFDGTTNITIPTGKSYIGNGNTFTISGIQQGYSPYPKMFRVYHFLGEEYVNNDWLIIRFTITGRNRVNYWQEPLAEGWPGVITYTNNNDGTFTIYEGKNYTYSLYKHWIVEEFYGNGLSYAVTNV